MLSDLVEEASCLGIVPMLTLFSVLSGISRVHKQKADMEISKERYPSICTTDLCLQIKH